jgi:protein arginine N-methyltransferase 1
VADIGTGTGIFALVACRLGARRVYAIDTNSVVEVGRELARENGFSDRIVFIQKDAREVSLPEPADVIVSDMYGSSPLCGDRLAVIADVRSRFLKQGGALIPASDVLVVAIVENADMYEWTVGPSEGPLGVTLEAMRARLGQSPQVDRGERPLRASDLISTAARWATLDYATLQPMPIGGRAELRVERAGTGHGFAIWFESVLIDGHGFSTAPGHDLCYGRLFLPWPRPVTLRPGDIVTADLWAQPSGDPWGWNTSVRRGEETRETFKQSSFLGFAGKLESRSPALERGTALSQPAQG